jgi:cyclopropane-fatty-acyl-phospholipid synthase
MAPPPPPSRVSSGSWALERWLVRRMLRLLGDPPIEMVLWDGQRLSGSQPLLASVHLADRPTLWRLVAAPDLHFGDAYTSGRIAVGGDLVSFLDAVYRAAAPFEKPSRRHRPHRNTLGAARANIHHHYDIGDDFYALWLDREMVYTCAYFPTPAATLEEAQQAKLELVCRKLWLRPGETVVEAGCGWGALALYMARHYGVTVKAYNISREQVRYAQGRARADGLQDRVEFIEDDYRSIRGQFDAFASVGMLEHVGPDHYRELGAVIDRCLSPVGRGLIHSIGRDQPGPTNPWIERRIFPGAYPPTLREMLDVLEPRLFSVLDVENLRLHYAETLRHWLMRFDSAAEAIAAMFDEAFVRAWRLYLAGSMAGFTAGTLQLFQVLFARHGVNNIPRTRARLEGNLVPTLR